MEDFLHPYLTFFAKKAAKTLRDMYDFLKENLCTDYKKTV